MFRIASAEEQGGGGLKGYLFATFDDIVSVLGPPPSKGLEVPAEWILAFDDGTIATLYCYKCRAIPKHFFTWHIGGRLTKAVHCLASALGSEILDSRVHWLTHHSRLLQERTAGKTYAWLDPLETDDGDEIPF